CTFLKAYPYWVSEHYHPAALVTEPSAPVTPLHIAHPRSHRRAKHHQAPATPRGKGQWATGHDLQPQQYPQGGGVGHLPHLLHRHHQHHQVQQLLGNSCLLGLQHLTPHLRLRSMQGSIAVLGVCGPSPISYRYPNQPN
ncbi:hypothetical protein EMCRGX_G005649, partial [Ephydatia muelleri]